MTPGLICAIIIKTTRKEHTFMRPTHPRYPLLERFDRYSQYITPAINRGIAEHRRGVFSLSFTDREGNAVTPDTVSVRQISHEFGFGCSLFLLDQFRTPETSPTRRRTARTARRSRSCFRSASRPFTGTLLSLYEENRDFRRTPSTYGAARRSTPSATTVERTISA